MHSLTPGELNGVRKEVENMISKPVVFGLIVALLSVATYAQTPVYTAPVKWERYSVGEHNVSVLLPKLPIKAESRDICQQEHQRRYALYAEDVVYGFNITAKLNEPVPGFCSPGRKFDETGFANRIREYKSGIRDFEEIEIKLGGRSAIKISNDSKSAWFINDFENMRWFEFWVVNGDETSAAVVKFINSLEKGSSGRDIGEGANQTLGDDTSVKVENDRPDDASGATAGIVFVVKPAPKYTDSARQNMIKGRVVLRVTFLESGGIGAVTAIETLPDGLTEQAIEAARRIIFLPARQNGKKHSVSKAIMYNFSVY